MREPRPHRVTASPCSTVIAPALEDADARDRPRALRFRERVPPARAAAGPAAGRVRRALAEPSCGAAARKAAAGTAALPQVYEAPAPLRARLEETAAA